MVADDPESFADLDGHESNWEKFKEALSKMFIAKGSVGAGIGGVARLGPLAVKAQAKVSIEAKYEGGQPKTEAAVKADLTVGKSGTMVGPQVKVPFVSIGSGGVQWGGKPTVGMTNTTRTGRDHRAESEVAQSAEATPGDKTETSFPVTVGGHLGPVGAEGGVDLAPIPEVVTSGLAALGDGVDYLGQKALDHLSLRPGPANPVKPTFANSQHISDSTSRISMS